jgi:hypothetical protein
VKLRRVTTLILLPSYYRPSLKFRPHISLLPVVTAPSQPLRECLSKVSSCSSPPHKQEPASLQGATSTTDFSPETTTSHSDIKSYSWPKPISKLHCPLYIA